VSVPRYVKVLLSTVLPAVVGLILLLVVIGWLAGLFTDKISPEDAVSAQPVKEEIDRPVYEVRLVSKRDIVESIGTLKAATRTEISSKLQAEITKIHVAAGDTVQAGDVLIELDRQSLERQLGKAKAGVRQAESTLARAQDRYNRAVQLRAQDPGVISEQDFNDAAFQAQAAQAARDQAAEAVRMVEVSLADTTIRAPKAGLIVNRRAEEGDLAQPGAVLLVLYDPSSLRLEVPVMAKLAIGLRVGDELDVQIDDLNNRKIRATIDEMVPQADEATRSFLIKVKLPPSPDLFEGMSGRLLVPGEERDHLCVHRDAIQTIGQLEYVTVLQDGTPERRLIKTGHVGDKDHVEVLSGLKAGDKVVLYGSEGDAESCRTEAPCGVATPSEVETPAVPERPSRLDPPTGPANEATSVQAAPLDRDRP